VKRTLQTALGTSQLGGERAYRGRPRKDRSACRSGHSIAREMGFATLCGLWVLIAIGTDAPATDPERNSRSFEVVKSIVVGIQDKIAVSRRLNLRGNTTNRAGREHPGFDGRFEAAAAESGARPVADHVEVREARRRGRG
jgi:hypothetical protein